ncbi:hypothetical protein ANCDUO_26526 [Ancylostoma duodenale]|uniref:Uncharacterized protein n=1 Tax=Ancylostoma duodenale TaxID=51022 RepID=A0A0C2C1M0_9BILA|nr:hypothetical protein ANCDUO_26526 [Ancylostoma duodenale]
MGNRPHNYYLLYNCVLKQENFVPGTHEELTAKEDSIYNSMVKAQEIAKGQEDTTLDGYSSTRLLNVVPKTCRNLDVDPVEIRRGVVREKQTTEEETQIRASLARESARIRQSMISTSTHEPEWEIERLVFE